MLRQIVFASHVDLKGPSHLEKSCYIRFAGIALNKVHPADYKSALCLSHNCLLFEKMLFEI